MPPLRCQHCGCTEIEIDPRLGDTVCTECGVVLAQNEIINQVQFMENSRGQNSAMGQFVSHESSIPRPLINGYQGAFSKSSREITLNIARKRITCVSNRLTLNNSYQEVAFKFFKLCLSKGLTRGRKSSYVIGACVYMACRDAEIPHMLIDISDIVEVDVYELGRTYLRISTALCLNFNVIDPCLYILKFAHKLDFEDKTHAVSETASRLVKLMKNDFIHVGRRPSGVCGAALVIAARFHNFNRTIQDVIKVVKVHESTLRKRLTEFGSTSSSGLTPEEFMNTDPTDVKEEEDPPSFKAARRREEEEKLKKLLEKDQTLGNQFTDIQLQIEKMLNERKSKLHGKWASAGSSLPSTTSQYISNGDKEATDTVQFIAEATMQSIHECMDTGLPETTSDEFIPEILPTTTSMGLTQTIEESMEIRPTEPQLQETGILDLEGIDDDEIDSYILTDRERDLKSNYWLEFNKDYLEEQEKKKEEERLENEQREKDGLPIKTKKVYKKKQKTDQPANTAGEAMQKVIKVKRLSNKINYDVLKNLNRSADEDFDNMSITSKASSSRSSVSSKRKASHPPIPESFREIMQDITGRNTPMEALQQEHEEEDATEDVNIFKKRKIGETEELMSVQDDQQYEDEVDDEEEDDAVEEEDDILGTMFGAAREDEEHWD